MQLYIFTNPKEIKKGNRYSFWPPCKSYGMAAILDCRAWRVSYCTSVILRLCVPHFETLRNKIAGNLACLAQSKSQ